MQTEQLSRSIAGGLLLIIVGFILGIIVTTPVKTVPSKGLWPIQAKRSRLWNATKPDVSLATYLAWAREGVDAIKQHINIEGFNRTAEKVAFHIKATGVGHEILVYDNVPVQAQVRTLHNKLTELPNMLTQVKYGIWILEQQRIRWTETLGDLSDAINKDLVGTLQTR